MRSISRSLGSGISILRSPSAAFGSRLFQRVRFRQRLLDLAGDRGLARRELRLQLFIFGLQPADFRIECGALVGHGVAGPAGAERLLQVETAPVRVSSRSTRRPTGDSA